MSRIKYLLRECGFVSDIDESNIALDFKVMADKLKRLRKELPKSGIDGKTIRGFEDVILKLSNMSVNIKNMGLEKGIRKR